MVFGWKRGELPNGLISTGANGEQSEFRDGGWVAFNADQDRDHVRQGVRMPAGRPDDPFERLWDALEIQESGGRQFKPGGGLVTSGRGAFGVAQLMPPTAREMAKRLGDPSLAGRALTDAQANRRLGREYLRLQFDAFGDPVLALAAYNAGPSQVKDWIKSLGRPPSDPAGRAAWVGQIPFPETRNYVRKILGISAGDAAPARSAPQRLGGARAPGMPIARP